MDDLVQWLRAQLDEEEQIARRDYQAANAATDLEAAVAAREVLTRIAEIRQELDPHRPESGQHPDFCGYDKRELPCRALRLLALPYAARPGYREEWRP